MASKSLQSFQKSLQNLRSCITPKHPRLSRSMATETDLPSSHPTKQPTFPTEVLTTIYKFPSMEPLRFSSYPAKHLHLPLRRDILHRAVIFEADSTRQGTGSTKTRWELHGSHRKLRPQKGMGSARIGNRQAPRLRGGAKAHGPKPRDFSTKLPRKMYDLAWRTALSYRYRKGDLIICENGMDMERKETEYAKQVFTNNNWGMGNGRSLLITAFERQNLFEAMEKNGSHGRVKVVDDVDVKNLLESGRLIIEKAALDKILKMRGGNPQFHEGRVEHEMGERK